MGLTERMQWLLFGAIIGAFCGYVFRYLQEIRAVQEETKKEVDEIDEIVKEKREARRKDDDGFVIPQVAKDVLLILVVVATLYASVISQISSNRTNENSKAQGRVVVCTQEYLSKTIRALNARTTYSADQASANVDLQQAQSRFLRIVLQRPPLPEVAREDALREYFDSLNEFVRLSEQSVDQQIDFPFPTNEELSNCLDF